MKRLQAFGLVNLEIDHSKIVSNVHLQLMVFADEIVASYKETDFVLKISNFFEPLREIFKEVHE